MTQYNVRLGPVSLALLQKIADHSKGISTSDVKKARIYRDNHHTMRMLDKLVGMRLICMSASGDKWFITTAGLNKLAGANGTADDEYKGVIVPPRRVQFDGLYQGAELRPQQSRPGGNTHTTIPSLIRGVRHFPGLDHRS